MHVVHHAVLLRVSVEAPIDCVLKPNIYNLPVDKCTVAAVWEIHRQSANLACTCSSPLLLIEVNQRG